MPIVEAHPTRQRSSSLKGASLSINQTIALRQIFNENNILQMETQEEERNEQHKFKTLNESNKSNTISK